MGMKTVRAKSKLKGPGCRLPKEKDISPRLALVWDDDDVAGLRYDR